MANALTAGSAMSFCVRTLRELYKGNGNYKLQRIQF